MYRYALMLTRAAVVAPLLLTSACQLVVDFDRSRIGEDAGVSDAGAVDAVVDDAAADGSIVDAAPDTNTDTGTGADAGTEDAGATARQSADRSARPKRVE